MSFYPPFRLPISQKTLNFAFVIELGRHIEILLLDYECVIVPGLGGFMAHHVEARYDESDNMFLPPLRTLGFNPQLKLNDSLLAQSYVEAYDLSYPEAVNRIEEEVNELKQHIQNEGSYKLNDVGTISLNGDGNYEFEPCEAGILTPWLYGLGAFEMQRLVNRQSTATPSDTKHKHTAQEESGDSATKGITLSACNIDKGTNDDDKVIKIKVAWIRNAIAIAAAFIAFLVITPPITNSYKGGMNVASVSQHLLPASQLANKTQTPDAIPTEKLPASKAVQTLDSIKVREAKESEQVAQKDSMALSKEKKTGYCLVLASRITLKNAEAFVDELHDNGWNDASVYVNNDIVRVVYGLYEKESDAYDTLRDIKNNKYFEQAWVYRKR